MTDDWVEEHMKDVTVAASQLHNEVSDVETKIRSSQSQLAPRDSGIQLDCQVIGNVDSGKSTLVGVLTKGGLDDGRGLARAKVPFLYRNETKMESQKAIRFVQFLVQLLLSGLQFLS